MYCASNENWLRIALLQINGRFEENQGNRIEQRLVTKNPTQGCALPKVEHKELKTLTADQLSTFFREARDSSVYELYYLDLATGLRRGELLGLKWTDVDLDRGVLKIQRAISRQNGKVVEAPLKTKNAYRTLPLSADAIKAW